MDLMHNQVIKIDDNAFSGIFRVVVVESMAEKVALVRIDSEVIDSEVKSKRGRKRLAHTRAPRKRAPLPLIGSLIWEDLNYLHRLKDKKALQILELELEAIYFSEITKESDQAIFQKRCDAMEEFLNFQVMSQEIVLHQGVGQLVQRAADAAGISKAVIYKYWSLLCRFGFSSRSLRPRRHCCGAPGTIRPCDPGGRKKAGAKTAKQLADRKSGLSHAPARPGMSTLWRGLILAADSKLQDPKLGSAERYNKIITAKFITNYSQVGGQLIPTDPGISCYPSRAQVRHVLCHEKSRLERLMEKTTKGHFNRSMRGLNARSWKGVCGPGHTWAIDSTIGDIYLRSSVNRAWIIGRPVVYILVDVWSTAVVGFYVCLTGPSWDTAKCSLFCAAADPALVGELWGYTPVLCLQPVPTMCATLLCDRGEFLSRAASATGLELIPCLSYAPPYRPDLKGLVEVLHRIEKNQQYQFIPGTIDARRKEYELRRFDPSEAVLTVREYTQALQIIFTEYNLAADRRNRLDTMMIAAGVLPSPAGLWRYGHERGIGVQRAMTTSELVTALLPREKAWVGRDGVRFAGLHYSSPEIRKELWTAEARNFGGQSIDSFHFPGSVSKIWTPNLTGQGLMTLHLSQQSRADPENTFDEVLDAFSYSKTKSEEMQHARVMAAMSKQRGLERLCAEATQRTTEALARYSGPVPTLTEARHFEITRIGSSGAPSSPQRSEEVREESEILHTEMMREWLAAANAEEDWGE